MNGLSLNDLLEIFVGYSKCHCVVSSYLNFFGYVMHDGKVGGEEMVASIVITMTAP